MNLLYVKKLHPDAKLPTRANETDAGLDLYALEDTFIAVGETVGVRTGLAMDVFPGNVGRILDRSSVALAGLQVGAGVVDAHYAGEIMVVLRNFSARRTHYGHMLPGYQIKAGDRIAQFVVQEVKLPEVKETVHSWEVGSSRGVQGLGSSGR